MDSTIQSETLKERKRSGDLDLGKRIILKIEENAQMYYSRHIVIFFMLNVKIKLYWKYKHKKPMDCKINIRLSVDSSDIQRIP